MGWVVSQVQIVCSPEASSAVRAPLPMTSRPVGAAIRSVKVALSEGWSLAGNQVAATRGWPTTTAPSGDSKTPAGPNASSIVMGTPL